MMGIDMIVKILRFRQHKELTPLEVVVVVRILSRLRNRPLMVLKMYQVPHEHHTVFGPCVVRASLQLCWMRPWSSSRRCVV